MRHMHNNTHEKEMLCIKFHQNLSKNKMIYMKVQLDLEGGL